MVQAHVRASRTLKDSGPSSLLVGMTPEFVFFLLLLLLVYRKGITIEKKKKKGGRGNEGNE